MWTKVRNLILEIFLPKLCFNCKKEGDYLCQDCQALLEISGFHRYSPAQNLNDLYWACDYENPIIKNLIRRFKYEPFVKELGKTLSSLITAHLRLMNNQPDFSNFIIIPVPLHKKRLKWRGFNQADEISKELSSFLVIPLISGCLIKTKETVPQTELTTETRKENIKGVFSIKNGGLVKNKKILLVDDIYTTGSTMTECAGILRKAGAKKIIGLVIARG